jgi:rhamnosyl/mannosyltransferase
MAKNVHHVHFAGSVPSADLPLAYRAADVHVLPSIDRSEAFGLVTEEAMASGIPSVVSNLPGVRSLVRHEETGLHVPPGDPSALAKALDYFCSDRNRAHEYGMRARRRAEMEYADEVLAHRMIALYRTLRHSV